MYTLLITYCIIIVIASIFGGSIPQFVKLTHQRIQLILSLVSGVMLGVAFFHLLPHAISVLESITVALWVALGGLLFMFFMVRMFHFHQHDLAVDSEHEHKQKHLCDEDHDHHHVHCESHDGALDFSWIGLCFGLAVHTVIDGIALAAAVQSSAPTGFSVAGMGVFLAILLHKPLDALSVTSLMSVRGWNVSRQMTVSLVFSLMCPLGAILFALGVEQFAEYRDAVLGLALAFSAGIFLCISLGDLLPEVHFHSHDRLKLSSMLFIGVAIAFLIESMHSHKGKQIGLANLSPPQQTDTKLVTNKARLIQKSGRIAVELYLAELPDSKLGYLEIWVTGEDSKKYSLGYVEQCRSSYRWPSGVDPSEFSTIDVSVEEFDGVPTHSGVSVLVGQFRLND